MSVTKMSVIFWAVILIWLLWGLRGSLEILVSFFRELLGIGFYIALTGMLTLVFIGVIFFLSKQLGLRRDQRS